MKLTQTKLKKSLHYNPETGIFTWLKAPNNFVPAGTYAGHISATNNHRYVTFGGKRYSASRLPWFYVHGYFPENEIDHIDRNTLNNKINNLRGVSCQCNSRNRGISKNNNSGITGVSWCKICQKWLVHVRVNYLAMHIGRHSNFLEAVCHRLAAEQCLGWGSCNLLSSSAYQYVKRHIKLT